MSTDDQPTKPNNGPRAGGLARAAKLTPEQRREIALQGVAARKRTEDPDKRRAICLKAAKAAGEAHKRRAANKRLQQIKAAKKSDEKTD